VALESDRNASPVKRFSVTLDRHEAPTLVDLILVGGPQVFIEEAVLEAAREARRYEAQEWLETLEAARPQIDALEAAGQASGTVSCFYRYIKTLRRMAGEKTPPDKALIRAQTRERVRRWRARAVRDNKRKDLR
jgi:hypothetical protein